MLNLKTGVLSLMCALVIGTVSARCPSCNRGNSYSNGSYPYGSYSQGYDDYGYGDHAYRGDMSPMYYDHRDMDHHQGYMNYGYDHHDNHGWDQGHMNPGYMGNAHYSNFGDGSNYEYDHGYQSNQRNTNANEWRTPEQEAQMRATTMQRDPMSNSNDWTSSANSNANKAANAANAAANQVAK